MNSKPVKFIGNSLIAIFSLVLVAIAVISVNLAKEQPAKNIHKINLNTFRYMPFDVPDDGISYYITSTSNVKVGDIVLYCNDDSDKMYIAELSQIKDSDEYIINIYRSDGSYYESTITPNDLIGYLVTDCKKPKMLSYISSKNTTVS